MSFELTILGSNSALPTANKFPTAQVLKLHERFFLIDCGEGTQIQLRRYKFSFLKINHIFISHLHGDHYYGIFGLLSTIGLLGRKEPLTIFGPKELKQILDFMLPFMQISFPVEFIPLHDDKVNLILETQTFEIFSFPLVHRVPTTGFLFREKPKPLKVKKFYIDEYRIQVADILSIKAGADYTTPEGFIIPNTQLTHIPAPLLSYAFCSDTAFDPRIADYAKNVTLMYHESTFLEEDKGLATTTKHSTAKDAASIAQMAGVKKLAIGHFSTRYPDYALFLKEAQKVFRETLAATEGMTIDVATL